MNESQKKLESFKHVFDTLEFEDKTKSKDELISIAKQTVIDELALRGYSIDSYIDKNKEVFLVANEKGIPIYIDYNKLEVEDFIKSTLRDKRISYGSEAESLSMLREEVAALREQNRDKRADKFFARVEEINSMRAASSIDLTEYSRQVQIRNEQIRQSEEQRSQRLKESNRRLDERNFPLDTPAPEMVYNSSKFQSKINERMNNQ